MPESPFTTTPSSPLAPSVVAAAPAFPASLPREAQPHERTAPRDSRDEAERRPTPGQAPLVIPTRRLALISLRAFIALAFVGFWEWGARAGVLDPFFYSAPDRVLAALVTWFSTGSIWPHILATLEESLLGLASGVIAAMVVGFALARNAFLGELFEPILMLLNAVPRIVLAPLLIMWFGIGPGSKVALSFLLVFFVVFFAVYAGVRDIDPILIRNARLLGARGFDLDREIYLPAALNWIFSSLRVAVGFAFTGAVVGEFLGASRGLGYLLGTAQGTFSPAQMLAGLIVIMALIGVVFAVVHVVERRLLGWKEARGN